jgi:cytochrome P450
MLTSFGDCTDVLRDRGGTFAEMTADAAFWFDAPNMLSVDGAEHHRLRDCLKDLFTKAAIAKWERRVVEVVDELLHPLLEGHDSFDIADFTKLPTVIVSEMLGVPEERHEDFRRWSHTIATGLAYGHERPETVQAMKQVAAEVSEYLTEEIDRHRRGEFDDVLSRLLALSEMTDAEMRSTALVLLLAGYDTTAKLLASALVTFEQHPDQRAALAANLSLMPSAIEEVLRWAGVAHIDPRVVVRETELAGTTLARGDVVYAIIAAANRDPDRWPDPHRFDVHRQSKSHLAFGYGPHLCIGLWLARLEAKVALQRLLETAPEYRLHGVRYAPSFIVRGPEQGFLDVSVASPA